MSRYHQLVSQLDVVQKISQDADERRCADPKADKEQHVIVPEILRWGAVGAIDQQPWRTASEPKGGKALLSFILIRQLSNRGADMAWRMHAWEEPLVLHRA